MRGHSIRKRCCPKLPGNTGHKSVSGDNRGCRILKEEVPTEMTFDSQLHNLKRCKAKGRIKPNGLVPI